MGNSEAVECLLDNHANIHAKNNKGQTPLHFACEYSNDMTLNILELLIDHGANIEAVDNSGRTPLTLACHHNNYLAVAFLLYHHANPDHRDLEKSTPLHIAVKHACVKMVYSFKSHRTVQALIAHGANINILNEKNRTPLHYAIEKMLSYDNDQSYCVPARRKNCEAIIKSLITQGIKLEAAGLQVMAHHSSVVYNSNDYIIIDNIKYSANDILNFKLDSGSSQVISNDEFHEYDDFIDDIRLVEAECKQEIEQMKKKSVGIDDLTFFDLVRTNCHFLRRLVRNNKFPKLLEMVYYNRNFPLYNDIIKNQLQRAKTLDKHFVLRMSANEYFMLNITKRLPYECIDKILSYFNIKELIMFIIAMKREYKCGYVKKAYKLIQNGANVNPDVDDNTPLHWAVIKLKEKHLSIIEILLDKGANIHARNKDNYTPLDIAIQDGKTEITSLLIQRGALVGEDLNPLLLKAINTNNHTLVQMIIEHGMLDNSFIDFQKLVYPAVSQGNSKIIKAIVPRCDSIKSTDLYIPESLIIKYHEESRESVEWLLKRNFIIHPHSYRNQHFIHGAVENGHLLIVLQLLNSGINVNMVDPTTELNLLTTACLNRHYEMIEKLLEHGANINVIISNVNNRLMKDECFIHNLCEYKLFNLACIAVKNGCEEIVRLLLDNGVNVAHINLLNQSLLDYSINFNSNVKDDRYNIIKLLLERGAAIHLHVPRNHFVFDAITYGHHRIAQLCLDYKADVQYINPDGNTVLHAAIKNNFNAKFIKTLLKLNSQVNTVTSNGHSPLLDACYHTSKDQLEIIQALLDCNADDNFANHRLVTPLFIACRKKNLPVVQVLLEKGANPNIMDIDGETPLHVACIFSSNTTKDMIQLLLEHGANIETVDIKGWTPLHTACEMGNSETVKCLLANNANLHATNDDGQTPLHIACKYSNDTTVEKIQLLLKYNGNIESVDKKGWTPLIVACEYKSCMAVEYLVKNYADPNATNDQGQTPLHIVSKIPHIKNRHLIKLLIEYGAKVDAVDNNGMTPLFLASNVNDFEAIETLLDHHANPNHVDSQNSTLLQNICKQRPLNNEKNKTPLYYAIETYKQYVENHFWSRFIHTDCRLILKALVLQKVKLKTAGLEVMNNNISAEVFNPDKFLTIDNVKHSANDILQLNLDSDLKKVVSSTEVSTDDKIGDMRLFEDRCKEEIEKMKKENVGVDDLTFYDLIKMDIRHLSRLFRNKRMYKILQMKIYDMKYPLYIDILRYRLRNAKTSYENYMLKLSVKQCFASNIDIRLPDEVMDMILDYLTNAQMKTFIQAITLSNNQSF
ncbi:ankyrin-1-like [Chelonus insularis]|uniref:ankyrin-1-like n=1 Tax=Chelonus insularis TaxID=460826 RepID=UPI00158EFA02|nr:ankyrin-1-like [Chelonus insularis]